MDVNEALILPLVLFLLCPEEGAVLELNTSLSEVILSPNSSFLVVCSGWGQVGWRFPWEAAPEGVELEEQGSSSILRLVSATWRQSGRYTCLEASSQETRELDLFIPGQGPEEWFVPTGPGVVMKEGAEGTIPCVVSDPLLNVSLLQRKSGVPVDGGTFRPSSGFTAPLDDTSYMCVAERGGQRQESQVYYVFSIVVPRLMEVQISSTDLVLQGDVLMVNCTVRGTEMAFFSWGFPRRQEVEPLTEFLPDKIRSFINISPAMLSDSGVYVCSVKDTTQGQTAEERINITVLARGFVHLEPSEQTIVSSRRHQDVELSLEMEAFPVPTVVWRHGNHNDSSGSATANSSVISSAEGILVSTTRLSSSRYINTLTLFSVQMNQSGFYTATVANDDEAREVTFRVEVLVPPSVLELSDMSSLRPSVLCVSEGAPPPSIMWYSCQSPHRCDNKEQFWQKLSSGEGGVEVQANITLQEETLLGRVHSLLLLQDLDSISSVRCEVQNLAGKRAWDLRLLHTSLFSQVILLSVVVSLVLIAVIFLIILILLWKKRPRYKLGWRLMDSVGPDQCSFVDPSELHYSSSWEVPRDNVVLGSAIGSGQFGRVVEASVFGLIDLHSSTKVMVKMLKEGSTRRDEQTLISELKILCTFEPHLNVVNLLGACTEPGPVLLIKEFCHHGDLCGFLKRNRHLVKTEAMHDKSGDSDGGYMDMSQEAGQYVAMETLREPISCSEIQPALYETPIPPSGSLQQDSVLPSLSLLDLISFSHQVAQGMKYLSSKKCVHRDLAARNVLVCDWQGAGSADRMLLKVGDLSLSRDLSKDSNYIARGNSFLPVKWMSPESIFHCVYTTQSDVWSYGVLLWEIFSLGETPYPDIPLNYRFFSALKSGHRMSRPQLATQEVYQLMVGCWNVKAELRPSFSSLTVAMGNSDAYSESYTQASRRFQERGDAVVVRSRQKAGQSIRTDGPPSDMSGDHHPQVTVHQAEVEQQEGDPAQSEDITMETSGQVLDTSSQQMESVHRSGSDISAQEVTSHPGSHGGAVDTA